MAFDGITVSALVSEFNDTIIEGRITKIAQPEADELILTIKTFTNQFRLLISANASLPLVYLTDTNKPSPLTAPNFCMLLRKHIGSGRIESITQPSLERIIDIRIQHLDELGDIQFKHLIIELMGKYSNIIFTDDDNNIIDSIKHVTSVMSSIRQVLPGKKYFIPDSQNKRNPLLADKDDFFTNVFSKNVNLAKAIYTTYTGFSPVIAQNLCYISKLDSSMNANLFADGDKNLLWTHFYQLINNIKNKNYTPVIYELNDIPTEYSVFSLRTFADATATNYDNISELIREYYSKKELQTRIRQKSSDLRKILSTTLEREIKKYNIQLKQLKDTDKKDKYKVYGDILTAYGYSIPDGSKSYTTVDFYSGNEITIPLDATMTPIENAKKYFDKYAKLKRTSAALVDIVKQTKNSIDYLETISVALDIATNEDDLKAIKNELAAGGYIKKSFNGKKKEKIKSKPLHYISSDGFDIFVGKNNIQNEELTFKIATGNDWWFHSKTYPGSHVIVKANNTELPDKTFEEAAKLAAYYSKGVTQDKVEIDYVQKKHVKKVAGAMPGFVIYHTNYSMNIEPNIDNIKEC